MRRLWCFRAIDLDAALLVGKPLHVDDGDEVVFAIVAAASVAANRINYAEWSDIAIYGHISPRAKICSRLRHVFLPNFSLRDRVPISQVVKIQIAAAI